MVWWRGPGLDGAAAAACAVCCVCVVSSCHAALQRVCEVCGFTEAAPFQLPLGAQPMEDGSLQALEQRVLKGIAETPSWSEALKNIGG
jgi:hypothetical protein